MKDLPARFAISIMCEPTHNLLEDNVNGAEKYLATVKKTQMV